MAKTTTPNQAGAARQRGVTMNDVAKHAGVSRTAVSFVLSNRENASISEETRARLTSANLDQLDLWADRILDAPTLAAVFDNH